MANVRFARLFEVEGSGETAEQRSYHRTFLPSDAGVEPRGATAAFVADVRRAHGDAFVVSWLLSGRLGFPNCRFTDERVYATGAGFDRLNSRCSEIAERHGVRLYDNLALREEFQKWGAAQKKPGDRR